MNSELKSLNLPLIFLVALNVLPSVGLRPWLFMALVAVLILYRLWIERQQELMPPRWVLFIIQCVVPILIWQHYESLFGDEAAGMWLIILTCLKLFELRVSRDYFITAGLCFFTLMSTLLLSQSLALSLFLLVDMILIFSFLYALEEKRWVGSLWKVKLTQSLGLFLRVLPLLVLIFVLFPRFSTGFGTGGPTTGKTGVTDRLQPGSISRLTPSDELIFRATFLDGFMPPRQALYWRGAVLSRSSGLTWDRSGDESAKRAPYPQERQDEIEIYLEPGSEKFLFTLDNTQSVFVPSDLYKNRIAIRTGRVFEFTSALQTRERYFLESGAVRPEDENDRTDYLQVLTAPSAQLRNFIKSVRKTSENESVNALAQVLRTGGYEYSLSPPQVDDLDEFFFTTKSGFCEHYAGATATILRYMGIPARVVVGFQGGSPSFLENYVTVRAYDAHAWVEYYDRSAHRWRRFDPTGAVAPARVALGSEALSQQGWLPGWVPTNWISSYLRARAFADEVDAGWIGLLARFDLARQRELMAALGMEGVLFRALPVFLMLAVALVMALLYFMDAHSREPISPEEKLYRRLLRVLKTFKIEKALNEGPMTLMSRIEKVNIQLAQRTEPILMELVRIRFGREHLTSDRIRELRKKINSLTP